MWVRLTAPRWFKAVVVRVCDAAARRLRHPLATLALATGVRPYRDPVTDQPLLNEDITFEEINITGRCVAALRPITREPR